MLCYFGYYFLIFYYSSFIALNCWLGDSNQLVKISGSASGNLSYGLVILNKWTGLAGAKSVSGKVVLLSLHNNNGTVQY